MRDLSGHAVERWLGRLAPSTRKVNKFTFAKWLDWMRDRGYEWDPDVLVECQKEAVGERRFWILDRVQEFVSEMEGRRASYKGRCYSVLRSFFAHNRAELPADRNFIISSEVPKTVGGITVDEFRMVVGGLNTCYRAVAVIRLQAGMGLKEFGFFNMNGWKSLERQMEERRHPIRIDLPGRKRRRNILPHYTFIGRNAISALEEYLDERPPSPPPKKAIFLNQIGRPVRTYNIQRVWLNHLKRLGLARAEGKPHRGTRYGKNPHELRSLFRSRWRLTGCDVEVAEFFMGHDIDKLGYDKSPKLSPEWFRMQYIKAEPWLNIMSGDREKVSRSELAEERIKLERRIEELERSNRFARKLDMLLEDPEIYEAFVETLRSLKKRNQR